MDWLSGFLDRRKGGYTKYGICFSCRRAGGNCPPERFANSCPNYEDNAPTRTEYLSQYAALLREMFAAEEEPARGDLYGAAQSRRKFLKSVAGIREEALRDVEDAQYWETEQNARDIRRLRWEL